MKSLHCAEYYTDAMAERDARHIAAHAPKEKAAWEAKEKALRELADRWMDEMKPTTTPVIHQSLICHEHALCIRAILNREQEKP